MVQVNGQEKRIGENVTVARLLSDLGIREDRVAVEINLEVLDRKDYSKTFLREGDKVEIITFVGGGG